MMTKAAQVLIEHGFSVIPARPDKKPAIPSWSQYQKAPMTPEEVNRYFTRADRLAVIGGQVSGNLECLDFDDPEAYAPFVELLTGQDAALAASLVKRKTPSGGYHLIYRCTAPVGGNQKLACDPAGAVRIETRGEGGYFLTAPSPGYEILEHGLLATPTISAEQRAMVHALARMFDQRPQRGAQAPQADRDHAGSPGSDFNARHSVADTLTRYGWREDRRTTAGIGWTRPGKEQGTSGVLLDGSGNFYIWSSNAAPLESGHSYSAFALYAVYEHGGDFTAAAKALAHTGYGAPQAPRQATPKDKPNQEQGQPVGQEIPASQEINETVSSLAALPPIEYDIVRKETAKALGVRPATLDQAVKDARKGGNDDDLPFIEVDPWPEPVDPARVLTDIAAAIRRFIVCTQEVANAVALWVAMTWFIAVVQVAPLAVITAPEKRCGKTQLLTLLGRLVARAIQASSISPAALFRTIDAWCPTLLIDEADAFMKDNEELRGLINSGHTRDSAYVIRTVGDTFTPTKFNTWGAKALSGIGHVADTLMDRAVILELRRKLPHEQVDRIRYAEPDLFEDLRAKLARFAEDYSEQVRQARPFLPPSLNDRAQDNWEPLLAIAMVAGGGWLDIGTAAALKLSGTESAAQTVGTELLADIKEVFETKDVGRISTAELIKALCTDDEKPWATFNKGFPIKPRQLASKLKGYGVLSKTVRFSSIDTAKGYEKNQFDEAFLRYIPSPPSATVTPSQPNNHGAFPVTDDPSRYPYVTERKTLEGPSSLACDGVTDRDPHPGSGNIEEVIL